MYTTGICVVVFTVLLLLNLFLCLVVYYLFLPTPSPPQLSLHPLHHFHVPVYVIQSLLSLPHWVSPGVCKFSYSLRICQ